MHVQNTHYHRIDSKSSSILLKTNQKHIIKKKCAVFLVHEWNRFHFAFIIKLIEVHTWNFYRSFGCKVSTVPFVFSLMKWTNEQSKPEIEALCWAYTVSSKGYIKKNVFDTNTKFSSVHTNDTIFQIYN